MHWATDYGHMEIVKYLSTWVDNPVIPNKPRCSCSPQTPLQLAVDRCNFFIKSNNFTAAIPYLEICSLLTPLTKNPNLSPKQLLSICLAVSELCRHNAILIKQLLERVSKFDEKTLAESFTENSTITENIYNPEMSNEQISVIVLFNLQKSVENYNSLKYLDEQVSELEKKKK